MVALTKLELYSCSLIEGKVAGGRINGGLAVARALGDSVSPPSGSPPCPLLLHGLGSLALARTGWLLTHECQRHGHRITKWRVVVAPVGL